MPRTFNTSGSKLTSVTQRPSAHLTLRDTNTQGEATASPRLYQKESVMFLIQVGFKESAVSVFLVDQIDELGGAEEFHDHVCPLQCGNPFIYYSVCLSYRSSDKNSGFLMCKCR